MASVLTCARVHRASAVSIHVARRAVRPLAVRQRGLHQSVVALAKKKSKTAAQDDPFADEEDMFGFTDQDDLFAPSGSSTQSSSTADKAAASPAVSREDYKKAREARFDALFRFVSDRIGAQPVLQKFPEQVRNTAWQQLFQLATTADHMERIVALFPKWRDSKRRFTAAMSEAFVRRCEELGCPTLALTVFSDHPKYGVDLTTAGARRLMHALHAEHPLADAVTLVALHSVYNLPPVSQDLLSCAMFTSACFKAGTTESLTVAHATLPALRDLLQNVDPATMEVPPRAAQAGVEAKEKVWLTWTLEKIQEVLEERQEPFDWLSVWRTRAGHVKLAT